MSKQLLRTGKADDYARILSGGSHANGTVKGAARVTRVKGGGHFGTTTTTTTTTKKKTSSSDDSNGGDGGDKGNTNKSNKEAKDFKETLDKIEILIDRIERKISNLDTIASNTFNNWTTRNGALVRSLSLVGEEIKKQEAGYKRYIQQANKVGLNSDLAKKVRNGEIGIQDVKNEDTWKKIEEYRKWWNSRHLIHLNAGKLRRHINYNARMKYT